MAAAGDLSAWRRENSNPVLLAVTLTDGTELRGTILVPRDRSLRELIIQPETFLDFDCQMNGPMLIAKSTLRSLRAIEPPKADQLDQSLKALEKMDVYGILKVDKSADAETIKAAAREQLKRFPIPLGGTSVLPKEVLDYLTTMRKRVEVARTELLASLEAQAAKAAKQEAMAKTAPRPLGSGPSGAAAGRVKPAA